MRVTLVVRMLALLSVRVTPSLTTTERTSRKKFKKSHKLACPQHSRLSSERKAVGRPPKQIFFVQKFGMKCTDMIAPMKNTNRMGSVKMP